MIKSLSFLIILFSIFGLKQNNFKENEDLDSRKIYTECCLSKDLSFEIFDLAFSGMQKIDMEINRDILGIIDFSKPSTQARLFIIDLKNKKLLIRSLVAHGKNSGENFASSFSNTSKSLKSCLGFFLTNETYYGKHGYSLRLDGLEKGINDNAKKRAIVIHGASYVSHEFAKAHGRIGRSWGCPALPIDLSEEIINKIKGGSCLFIYADDEYYLKNSKYIHTK
jgi:hypothetical protein